MKLRPGHDPHAPIHALNESTDVWDRTLSKGGLSDSEYGRNRARLEAWVRQHYPGRHLIIRLPGILGHGMKKNIVFDLITVGTTQLYHILVLQTVHFNILIFTRLQGAPSAIAI
jgi:hypothetical protein